MGDVATGFAIVKFDGLLSNTEFEAISPDRDWDNIVLKNDSPDATLYIRTDKDEAATEYAIPPAGDFQVAAPRATEGARFRSSRPAFFAKMSAGAGEGVWCTWA